jgi:pilus assembly protein Flp/PilA
MQALMNYVRSFAREEDGAQLLEYALIVAVISLGLIIAFQDGFMASAWTGWITRVSGCLSGGGVCA